MSVCGVLLAAGGSRRFGAPKQLAALDGRPLVTHALDALVAVPLLAEVLVVVGAHGDEVATAVADRRRVRVVPCARWAEGMAASLRAGVAAVRDADAVLVALGDQPGITPAVVARVLLAQAPPGTPVRATYDGAPGHPVVLPRTLFAAVAALAGDAGARTLLGGAALVEVGHLGDPRDVDTPADLAALRRPE